MPLDLATLHAAARGDAPAVAALVREWGGTVLQWCRRLGGPRIDAEDAAQDSLERALRKLPSLRTADALPGFLLQTTRGVISQHRRRAWFRRWIGADPPAHLAAPPPTDHALDRAVWDAVDTLPDDLRAVLVLCDLEERPDPEVARLLGLPEGTVKSRLRRARARFADVAKARELHLHLEAS